MKRYLRPYKKYLVGSVVLNILSQWLNVFSFVVLIPILNILFEIDQKVYTYKEITWSNLSKDALLNNGYAYVQELIASYGAFATLCMMGFGLIFMTGLKTFCYFAASAV
ncbi:MAG: ABC transporter ATP-binding protein, partial [Prevotella sp.]|nr:ABC transporter ATP-binding protein [Prevotella sp.]